MGRLRHLIAAWRGLPPRLLGFALTCIVLGIPVVAGAVTHVVVAGAPPWHTALGIGLFFALALAAELRPVPLDVEGEWVVSFAFVFVVSSVLLFGWGWGVLIGAGSIFLAQLQQRVDPLRLAFNSAVYAIATGAAALPQLTLDPGHHARLGTEIGIASLAGALFVGVNVALVCGAIGLSSAEPIRNVMRDHLRRSGPAFCVMVFVVAQTVNAWKQAPYMLALVGAPLFALSLYQHAATRRHTAEREAARDSLTGLGNHRAYEETIGRALAAAAPGGSLSLCLVDVDRFKQVNDRYGHPAGDTVLSQLGALLAELAPGRGFRIGGDEFVVLLDSSDPAVRESFPALLQERLAALTFDEIPDPVTVSIGVAHFPDHAHDAAGLKRQADLALYRSKRNGKNRSSIFRPDDPMPAPGPDDPAEDGSIIAVRHLIAALVARHPELASHSSGVADLARAIGRHLGVTAAERESLYLAGLLHDLGKISTPDSILLKAGPLTPDERLVMQQHSRVGFELLDGLNLTPLDGWVLHHHEHWDGGGYPDGLVGAEIPFGSRILHVADAFDAMISARPYRGAISVEGALGELRDFAGRQFDPLVVSALEACLAADPVHVPAPPTEVPA